MTKRPLHWLVFVLVLPWLLPTVVVLLQRRPDGIDLRGEWAWSSPDGTSSGRLTLPAFFHRAKVTLKEFTLRRTVELDGPADEPWLLVLGDLRSSVIRVVVNGRHVGDMGAWASRQKADFNGLDAVQIPPGVLKAGVNELELHVASPLVNYAAISDRRLVLGPASQLGEWYLRTSKAESFLRAAPLLVFGLLVLLLVALASLHGPAAQRRLALRALSLVGASTVYQALQTGLGLTGLVPTSFRVAALFLGVVWSITATLEFCADYFQAWRPRWVWANRGIGLSLLLSAFVWPFTVGYLLYSAWSFFLILGMMVIMLRALRTDRRLLTLLLTSTTFAFIATGIGDVFTDLGVWHLPRLFALSLANAPILIGAVVIGTFLALGERNRALTQSLGHSNEELAKALVEAREATRVKSEFLANVSHELRTPLNSIINIPEGLLEDFATAEGGQVSFSGDAGRTARFLRSLHSSGVHLLGVVNQVLDFSKIEAGRLVLTHEDVVVSAVLSEVVRTLEPQAAGRSVRLACTGDTSGTVSADAPKLAQVLLNLVSNAVKFSPDGATVELRVERTREHLLVHVTDSGIGIALEHQAFIFEGFRQVEGGATRRFGGTGLGLAISRKLVELHGGALTLISAPGQGSTFTASFPLVARVSVPQGAARPTVVVIDDEPLVQETLRLSLRTLELELVAVSDPRQALEVVRRTRPVLVILDVMMPRVSGVTLLRQLRSEAGLSEVPVLVLSAWPSNRAVVEGLGASWMSKPWREEALVSAVKAFLSGAPAGSPRS